jgi:hypothetical protein
MFDKSKLQRGLVAVAAILVIGFTAIGCNKTEQKAVHDPKTDITPAERKDKQGDYH